MEKYKIFIETPIKQSEPMVEYHERISKKLLKSGVARSPRTLERWYREYKKTSIFKKHNSLLKEFNCEVEVTMPINETPKLLFYDIEVSPCVGFFWRPGYNLTISPDNIINESAIICIAYKWAGEDKVHSIKWENGDDKALMTKFAKVTEEADIMCGHNSKDFDDKWIRTRALLKGVKISSKFNSIDTLKMARSGFKFNSNKLDYLSKVTGNKGKISTSFELWKKIVLENDKKSLNDMITYCENDVVELENLYNVLQPYCPIKKFRTNR